MIYTNLDLTKARITNRSREAYYPQAKPVCTRCKERKPMAGGMRKTARNGSKLFICKECKGETKTL